MQSSYSLPSSPYVACGAPLPPPSTSSRRSSWRSSCGPGARRPPPLSDTILASYFELFSLPYADDSEYDTDNASHVRLRWDAPLSRKNSYCSHGSRWSYSSHADNNVIAHGYFRSASRASSNAPGVGVAGHLGGRLSASGQLYPPASDDCLNASFPPDYLVSFNFPLSFVTLPFGLHFSRKLNWLSFVTSFNVLFMIFSFVLKKYFCMTAHLNRIMHETTFLSTVFTHQLIRFASMCKSSLHIFKTTLLVLLKLLYIPLLCYNLITNHNLKIIVYT